MPFTLSLKPSSLKRIAALTLGLSSLWVAPAQAQTFSRFEPAMSEVFSCAVLSADVLMKYKFFTAFGGPTLKLGPLQLQAVTLINESILATLAQSYDSEQFLQLLRTESSDFLQRTALAGPEEGRLAYVRCVGLLANQLDAGKFDERALSVDKKLMLRRFLADEFFKAQAKKEQGPKFASVTGSGFFVSRQGHIVTNNHVIEGRTRVRILHPRLSTPLEARLIDTDPETDLALLKIEYETQPIALAQGELKAGDAVTAMGFPKLAATGFTHKTSTGPVITTTGILSEPERLTFAASVDHGSSGGPLMDASNNLVGVVFGKFTLPHLPGRTLGFGVSQLALRSLMDKNQIPYEYAQTPAVAGSSITDSIILILAQTD